MSGVVSKPSSLEAALAAAARGPLSGPMCRAAIEEVVTATGDDATRDLRCAALLGILAGRGVAASELEGAVDALLAHARFVDIGSCDAIDTCGTGGDGGGTFNVSTATALLVAALGVPVAKHGNRSVSSTGGSADLVEALGLPLEHDSASTAARLEEERFVFLFAPRFHPALRNLGGLRRTLGFRTLFNLAAPLSNPARVRRQVVGVADEHTAALAARVLEARGSRSALVVFGRAGERIVDELTPCGPCRLRGVGGLADSELDPLSLGIERCELGALAARDAAHSAALVRAAFGGRAGPVADTLVLNAAAALVVAGFARDLRDGAEAARAALASGRALAHLERLARRGAA